MIFLVKFNVVWTVCCLLDSLKIPSKVVDSVKVVGSVFPNVIGIHRPPVVVWLGHAQHLFIFFVLVIDISQLREGK